MRIRAAEAGDRAALTSFLERWQSLRVARRGALEYPLEHPMLVAERDGRIVAALTYVVRHGECEVLTLQADERRRGAGTALLAEVKEIARRAGCARVFLTTTNDNVDALRFYQRRGFRLAALHCRAVDQSRARLKPEIPTVGDYGIPIRDELELEQKIGESDTSPCPSVALGSTHRTGGVAAVSDNDRKLAVGAVRRRSGDT